ncbi:MAG: DNA internalization-related competence protein ComEC/Rec2 [Firmicutes bacterium]|nr:DNA internalization-related competence protein ComEC/Rec2 [Bacillota bacterium]
MRRKLFLCAVILTGTVFLVSGFFPDLWVPKQAVADGSPAYHEGVVLSVRDKDDHYMLELRDPGGFKVRVNIYDEVKDTWELIGKRIRYRSKLTYGDPARNPHCFDYRKYLRSSDVFLTGTIRSYKILSDKKILSLKYASALTRIREAFERRLPESSRGMITGMLFGDTGEIEDEVYEDFRRNGTAHILAVSGLHIGLLYSVYEKLTGGKTSTAGLVILAFLMCTYGTLTMWRPSVIRAEMMIGMKSLAKAYELRYDSLTAMSAAAILLIVNNPYVVYGIGFQMSFLAIISINIITSRLPEKVPKSLSQAISVNLSMILYQAYVFNYISPLAVLINLPVLYLAGIALPAAFAAFGAYALTFALGKGLMIPVFYIPASSVTDMMVWLNSLLTFGDRSSLDVKSPPAFVPALAIGLLLFLCSEYSGILKIRGLAKKTLLILLIIAVSSGVTWVMLYEPISHDEIVFVDVGQGACTHIRAGKTNVLIDGGGKHDRNQGEKLLKPYLLKNGVKRVDLSLATHEDIDHIKGLEELAECFRANKPVTGCTAGKRYELSEDVYIETLWPLETGGAPQENENSSVFMINYRGIRIMVTGDLDTEGEKKMIEYYKSSGKPDKLKADVLNVGHHGSITTTSEELLDADIPSIAEIQVGRNNYGHPKKEVLDRLKEHKIAVFRNDENGAIGLDISDKNGKAVLRAVHLMMDSGC